MDDLVQFGAPGSDMNLPGEDRPRAAGDGYDPVAAGRDLG
jgi:hypothetical protein